MMKRLIGFLIFIVIVSACSFEMESQTTPVPLSLTTAVITEHPLTATSSETINNTLLSVPVTPAVILTPSPDFWVNLPVVPINLSDRVRRIYQRGLEMGNDPRAFSKVGDCHSTNPYFLADYDLGTDTYDLGDYAYLQPAIDYFAGSFSRTSLAAKKGLSTA